MRVFSEKLTSLDELTIAAGGTLQPGQQSKISYEKMLQCEHSPIRTQIYRITMEGVPSFVSVHFVRHKFGVEHFVQSNRDDRASGGTVDRNTPIKHIMIANAQSLIFMARKRLCLKAHKKTVGAMNRIRRAVRAIDPAMAKFMVPECVYRNGLCPEAVMCGVGVDEVCASYEQWPGIRQ